MFLQWAVPGSLLPVYSLRLNELGFSPLLIGLCCATQAVATVASSLLAGQIADRWLAAERALAICSCLAAGCLWVLANTQDPMWIFVWTLLFWMTTGPLTLYGTTISFAHLENPKQQFGPVRMWGTIGWMAIGWLAGWWFATFDTGWADSYRLGAILALVLAIYSFTLPSTPPSPPQKNHSWFAPLEAMHKLRERPFAVYACCVFLVCVTFPFTTQNTPLLLEKLNVPRSLVTSALTIAQTTEVVLLGLLPVVLGWLGLRRTMIIGAAAWLIVLSVLSVGEPLWLIISGLALSGIYITCFMIAGQVFVNSLAEDDDRASIQGLLNCINGAGLLFGHLLAGSLRWATGGDLPKTFMFGALVTLTMLILFVMFFEEKKSEEQRTPGDAEAKLRDSRRNSRKKVLQRR
jgi:MFS family permease